jgi:hypothetical protein
LIRQLQQDRVDPKRIAHLDHIVVLSTDAGSKTSEVHVLKLDTSRPVKFSLQNTRMLEVALTLDSGDPYDSFLKMSPSPGEFKLTRRGRRLKQATGASRIIKVIVPFGAGKTKRHSGGAGSRLRCLLFGHAVIRHRP